MKVVIVAGGKGTRIASVNSEIPKAMIPVNGKPVLEMQVELAKRYGYRDIIIVIGHLGEKVSEYFGDGQQWDVNITYFKESAPLGTAGALADLKSTLTDDFFLFYGDTVMDISLDRMLAFHQSREADATLLLHPNDHPYDSDLVSVDENGIVDNFFSKPRSEDFIGRNLVNAALYILSPKIVNLIDQGVKSDFGKDIFPRAISKAYRLAGYITPEYIKDMGTPDRYEKVNNDVVTGKVARLNCSNKRPAIFLDRDGVVCKEVDLLSHYSQVELIEGAGEAIKHINASGYLAVLVTNQPVIARNLCTIEELDFIHAKLETLLGEEHAYLDAIYYCPHHPDSGYPEERVEYKIPCDCRKPNPGMLLTAAKDLNIDIANSYIIGDRESDRLAGERAGVKESLTIKQNAPNALYNQLKELI